MIMKSYSPLNLRGMGYDRLGQIIVINREEFLKTLAEQIDTVNLDDLLKESDERMYSDKAAFYKDKK